MPVNIPRSLDEILASLGLTEYSDLFGGQENIADYYGLPEGADYSQFFTDFPLGKLQDILGGLPDYAQQQYGFVTGQYDVGKKAAGERFRGGRFNILEKMRSTLPGLREKTGGFAGGRGIKDVIERFRRGTASKFTGLKGTTSTMLQDLLQSKERGMSSAQERVLGKVGGVESLVADWLDTTRSQATYLKSLDPTALETLLGDTGDSVGSEGRGAPFAPPESGLQGVAGDYNETRAGIDGNMYRLEQRGALGIWVLVGRQVTSTGSGGGGASGFGMPEWTGTDEGDMYPSFNF